MTRLLATLAGLLVVSFVPFTVHAQVGGVTEARELAADGRYEDALERLGAHLKEHPGDVEARFFQGVVYTRQGRTEEAIEVFQRLASDHPELAEPHNNLAVLFAASGRYDEARDALLSAVRLRPDYSTAHENLGDLYAKLASLAYEKAHELDRDNTRVRSKVEIVSRVLSFERSPSTAETPTEPSQATAPPGPDPACLKLSGYDDTDARNTIMVWLDARAVRTRERTAQRPLSSHYNVYMPPLDSAEAANAQVERMRREGIQDVARFSRGELENGISLGVYSFEDRAKRRVAQLAAKGYESRYRRLGPAGTVRWLETTDTVGKMDEAAFARAFPFVTSERIPCK